MSSDDDKKKKPSYRAPDNYSQYGRSGTNRMDDSVPVRRAQLVEPSPTPVRRAQLVEPSPTPVRRAQLVEPSPTPVRRAQLVKLPAKRTAPARKAPVKSSGPSKAVYSGGLNDPRVQEAIPSSSSSAAKRLVYSEGRPPQDSPTLSRDVYNPLVSGSGSKTLSRDVPNPLVSTKKMDTDKAAQEIADARRSNQSYMPHKTQVAKKKTPSRHKHSYSVKYAKD
jgi:hypothetical protein